MSIYQRILKRNRACEHHVDPKKECVCMLDSAWSVRIERADRTTIRKRVGSYVDAVKEERDLLVKSDKGTLGRRATLSQYVKRHWPIGDVSEQTAAKEKSTLDSIILPRFGKTELSRISKASALDMRRDLQKQKRADGRRRYSDVSINDYTRLLRKILHDAFERKDLAVLPQWPKALKEAWLRLELSTDEEKALLAAFDDREGFLKLAGNAKKKSRDVARDFERFRSSRPLFVLAIETGLDLSDLLALKWSAVEEDRITGKRGKSGEAYLIAVSKRCREALADVERQGRRNVSGHVLLTSAGQPYAIATVARYWRKAKKLAGITRRCRFKDLRHTCGSILASKNVSLPIIGKHLGHAPGSVTTARYSKPEQEAALETVRRALDSRG